MKSKHDAGGAGAMERLARRVGCAVLAAAPLLWTSAGLAAPADVTLVASGGTLPAAIVQAGSDIWVSDHTLGFCRVVNGGIDQASCVLGGAVSPGQAVFRAMPTTTDANAGVFYVPDNSSKSQGVWQYGYSNGGISSVNLLAPGKGLGGNRPLTVAWAEADKKLYIAFGKNSSVVRVDPALPSSSQNTESVGTVTGRVGPPAMTFIGAGTDLYFAEATGVTRMNVSGCTGGCRALAVQGVGVGAPVYLTSDGTALFIADLSTAYRFLPGSPLAGSSALASRFSGISALGAGSTLTGPVLYTGDDPSAGNTPGTGRIWQTPLQ